MQRRLVRKVTPFGMLDQFDLGSPIRSQSSHPAWPLSVNRDPGRPISIEFRLPWRAPLTSIVRKRGSAVVIDFRAGDDGKCVIQQVNQLPQQRRLGLTA